MGDRLCGADRDWMRLCIDLGYVPVEDRSTAEACARVFARALASIDEAWGVVDELSALLPEPDRPEHPTLWADQLTLEAP